MINTLSDALDSNMQYQDNSTHFGLSGMDQTYEQISNQSPDSFFDHSHPNSTDFQPQELPQAASLTNDMNHGELSGHHSVIFHSDWTDNDRPWCGPSFPPGDDGNSSMSGGFSPNERERLGI
jgi:hypothetical protein